MKVVKYPIVEYFILIISLLFLFGCLASSYRTAKTQKPGQVSFGAGYLRASNMDNTDAEPLEFVDLNIRTGIVNGLDFGAAYNIDMSSEGDEALSTFWGDLKIQLNNRDNNIGTPTISLNILKGYVSDYETHVTSFPIMVSLPVNEHFTPTLQYRYSVLSDGFIPGEFKDPRHEIILGLEYNFTRLSENLWTPKLGFSIGTFNSLTGGEGDRGLVLNLGLIVDSPIRY